MNLGELRIKESPAQKKIASRNKNKSDSLCLLCRLLLVLLCVLLVGLLLLLIIVVVVVSVGRVSKTGLLHDLVELLALVLCAEHCAELPLAEAEGALIVPVAEKLEDAALVGRVAADLADDLAAEEVDGARVLLHGLRARDLFGLMTPLKADCDACGAHGNTKRKEKKNTGTKK